MDSGLIALLYVLKYFNPVAVLPHARTLHSRFSAPYPSLPPKKLLCAFMDALFFHLVVAKAQYLN